jgi:hypothetical protein
MKEKRKIARARISVHPLSHRFEFKGLESFKDVAPALRATDYKAPPVALIEYENTRSDKRRQ